MQNKWYGDNRDLVKWGTLIHLAGGDPDVKILQVLMMRPDGERHSRLAERGPHGVRNYGISESVFDHFRRVQNITSLDRRIIPHADAFPNHDYARPRDARTKYFRAVCARIRRLGPRRLVVLVDPDNGINTRNPRWQHISAQELIQLYQAIKDRDTLVLYQHSQHRQHWLDITRKQFANAIRIGIGKIRVFQCCELASNVALFAVKKHRARGQALKRA